MFGATLANLLSGVFGYVILALQVVVMANILCKWAGVQESEVVKLVNQLADKVYNPIRKFTARVPGPFDWAPIIALLVLVALDKGIVEALYAYAKTHGF